MKYLALDIGNVLCDVDQNVFVHLVSYKLNMSVEQVERFMKRFWELHDVGFTNIQDELTDKFGVKSELIMEDLLRAWNNVITSDEHAIHMIEKIITDHNVQIGIVSNMGIEHMKAMETDLKPIYDTAVKHFSCEVGARKPSKLFYQSFLMQYPEFQGCLYVDDLRPNLDAAAQFGFKPFHFDLKDKKYERLDQLYKMFSE